MIDSPTRLLRSLTALALLAGFLVAFVPDWTGLDGHQILGTALGVVAIYHAWVHRIWIGSLARRLWKTPPSKGQWLWFLDAALAGAFAIIIGTGWLISTWVGLPSESLTAWINLHVVGSVTTLFLVVVKVATHWRWFVQAFRQRPVAPVTVTAPVRATGPTRRDFLALMGTLSVAAVAAGTSVLRDYYGAEPGSADSTTTSGPIQASSSTTTFATSPANVEAAATAVVATAEAASTSTSGSTTCTVRCQHGCSYPGRCRKYADSNGNLRCDYGECL